jgi:hypothetical protein
MANNEARMMGKSLTYPLFSLIFLMLFLNNFHCALLPCSIAIPHGDFLVSLFHFRASPSFPAVGQPKQQEMTMLVLPMPFLLS